jgi:hypothetical protein
LKPNLRLVPALLFVVAVPSALGAQQSEIFREVSIQPFGMIRLGEAFSQKDSLGAQLAENVFLLPSGFGGTAGIAVVLDPDELVAGLVFEYDAGTDLVEMVAEYRAMLGEPLVNEAAADGTCVLWQDRATRFEIYEGRFRDQDVVASMMIDLGSMTLDQACALRRFMQLGIGRSIPFGY